jgi:Fur family peroxide stress response transcriptional regulator
MSFVKISKEKKNKNYFHFLLDFFRICGIIISRMILDSERSDPMTKQQTLICDILANVHDHLTAEEVFFRAREQMPNIAMGTVYRNLASLVESGEILSVSVGDGYEHFDGDKSFHLHLHCKECGAIIDSRVEQSKIRGLGEFDGFRPETSVCVVYGICKNCNKQ